MELSHAILGLLSVRPMSGYDLGRAFAASVAHFWHADQSQIYRTIDRLAAAGAIETEVIRQDGKPDRKVHSLTERGRGRLDAWLESPLEAPKPKIPFLARLFFVSRLGRDAALRLLDKEESLIRAEQEQLRAIDAGNAGDGAGILREATLRFGIAGAEAELEWIAETRRRIDEVEEWES